MLKIKIFFDQYSILKETQATIDKFLGSHYCDTLPTPMVSKCLFNMMLLPFTLYRLSSCCLAL